MARAQANGIEIEYDTFGDPGDPALLLIMGLGAQLIAWDVDFVRLLVDRGLHVIRYDNRDVGLSTKIEGGPQPDIFAAMQGDTSSASYTLRDMAADGAGLLDALGIERAHIGGASMGGMIAQTFAIDFPDRTLSLCSIMSTTGDLNVGGSSPAAIEAILAPPPATREEAMDRAEKATSVFGAKGLPVDMAKVRERAGEAFDRMAYPIGIARQIVAIRASGDRTPQLQELDMPTVVIHGSDDELVLPTGGEATAKAIPGAELVVIEGMGHDLPTAAWPQVVDAIAANIGRAGARR